MILPGCGHVPHREQVDAVLERVAAFLTGPLQGDWPYLRIEATCLKMRQAGRLVSAVVVGVATVAAYLAVGAGVFLGYLSISGGTVPSVPVRLTEVDTLAQH